MDLFALFCNICYCTTKTLNNVSTENERIKYILLSIVGSPEIVNGNMIYLCSSCCEELTHIDKFRETCHNNFLHFRKQYMQLKHMLELQNDGDIIKKLKDFIEEKVFKARQTVSHKYEEINKKLEVSINEIICTTEVVSEQLKEEGIVLNEGDIKFEIDYDESRCSTNVNLDNQVDTNTKFNKGLNNHQDLLSELDPDNIFHTKVDLHYSIAKPELTQNENNDLESDVHENDKDTDNSPISVSRNQEEMITNTNILAEGVVCGYLDTNSGVLKNDIIVKRQCDEAGSDKVFREDIKLHSEIHLENSDEESDNESTHMSDSDSAYTNQEESNSDTDVSSDDCRTGGSATEQGNLHVCEYCSKCFKYKNVLDKHLHIHNGERPYKCNTCDRSFTAKSSLVVHTRSHTGEKPYQCSTCHRSFTKKSSLVVHTRIHTGERPYKCTTCDRNFIETSALIKHTRSHTGERQYKCNTCDRSFTNKYRLIRHTRTHTGERPYKCNTCDRSFIETSALIKHTRTHTEERQYKCNTCDRSFTDKYKLVRHIRTHTGERPYKCNTCDRSFTVKYNLVAHTRTHTGERPYKCSTCNHSFLRKSNLVAHTRTHTEERPYKCNICYRSFTEMCNLVAHTRIHTNERPFKCNTCDRSFTENSKLTAHIRTHTGERPYKCNTCNRSFTEKGNLVRHMRIHIGEKP